MIHNKTCLSHYDYNHWYAYVYANYTKDICENQLQKINDNAYRLRLSSHLRTSNVFNVKHLNLCFVDADMNSRTSSFQSGEIDTREFEFDDAE